MYMNFQMAGKAIYHHNFLFGCPGLGQVKGETCPGSGQARVRKRIYLSQIRTTVSQIKVFYLSQIGTDILYIAI